GGRRRGPAPGRHRADRLLPARRLGPGRDPAREPRGVAAADRRVGGADRRRRQASRSAAEVAAGGRMSAATVLAYGGGTQTVGMCLLVGTGSLPRPDRIVMADTGREVRSTFAYL